MKQQKSRARRRVKVKTPGGRVVLHYRQKKPQPAHCTGCGAILKGVPRLQVSKLRQLPKTQRRPQRPYGGVLCSKCTRATIQARARA